MVGTPPSVTVEGLTFELNSRWLRVLRFLNFLEPDAPARVDWGTLGFATMGLVLLATVVYIAFWRPGDYAAVLGALSGFVPFLINTVHQRMHYHSDDH